MNLYKYSLNGCERHVLGKNYEEAESKINTINQFKNTEKNEIQFRKISWIKLIEENVQ